MPPSGYSFQQSDHVVQFLLSCTQSLIRETLAEGLSPVQGLAQEIANIDKLLNSEEFSEVERTLFAFNRHFYSQLLARLPTSHVELEKQSTAVGEEIRSSLLSVEHRTPSILTSMPCTEP